jgi:hypothetical protein
VAVERVGDVAVERVETVGATEPAIEAALEKEESEEEETFFAPSPSDSEAPPVSPAISFSFANPVGAFENDSVWHEVMKSQWSPYAPVTAPSTPGSRTSTRSKDGAKARAAKESKE